MNIDLNSFFEVDILKTTLIKFVPINIILCDDEWLSYYHYTKDRSHGVDLAKVDNGSGDNMLIFFTDDGCLIKGFDHDSEVSIHVRDEFKVWEGIYFNVTSTK